MKTLAYPRWAALALVLALSFTAALTAHAQETTLTTPKPEVSPSELSFGVRAGLVQTDFYGESAGSTDPGTSLTGGAFLTYRISPVLALQPEVLYTRRTGEVDHSRLFEDSRDVEYTLSFLNVPLLLKASLPDQNGTVPYLLAGPYAGVRLSEEAEDRNNVMEDVNLDDELRAWDYGLTAGLGMESYAGRRTLSFDVRYTWGLANLFSEENRPGFHTRGFTFSFGLGL